MRQLHETDLGQHVRVYFNLHRKCWSVQYKGRVIGHTTALRLEHVTFQVSDAGRQRVIREGKKNVHAYCAGTLVAYGDISGATEGEPVTYNPYKASTFVLKNTPAVPVHRAIAVTMVGRSVIATLPF